MQFFAYDQNSRVFAEDAFKGKDYLCPECNGLLRVKSGVHRRKHFFHLRPTKQCHLSQKSALHLTIQKAILQTLSEETIILEKRFPAINRIADVVWEERKTIFEVQCSPIALSEVKERMTDYQKEGYRVIWILQDHRFNKKRLSAAERYLRPLCAFFTSINQKGKGLFYNQSEQFEQHKRIYKSSPVPLDLKNLPQKPLLSPPKKTIPFKKHLQDRLRFFYYLLLKKAL